VNRIQKEEQVSNLVLLVIFILVIGFSITTGLSYYLTREFVLNTAVAETLPLVSKNIYTAIMEDLIGPIDISSLMANDSFLIEWVTDGESDLDKITTYLGLIKEEYGFSSAFFVSSQTGNYYTPEGILKQVSPEDEHDVWYYHFVDLDQETDLDVDNDQADQDSLTVFINHRLTTSEDENLGVTGVGLRIEDVSEKLERYEEIYQHQIYFVDGEGLIQIHSDQDLIEQKTITDITDLGEVEGDLFTQNADPQYFEVGNLFSEKVYSIRYFPDFDWYLVVEKDQGANLSFVKGVFWKTITIGIAVSLLVALVIIRLIKIFHARLTYQARIDPLTQVYNRRALIEIGEREVRLAQRHDRPITVMMVDVADFKSVNEQFGHLAGDEYLTGIAETFTNTLRSTDLVGRWGGDEFLMVLIESGKQEAHEVEARLREAVEEFKSEAGGEWISRDIHLGMVCNYEGETTFFELVEAADQALIKAKNS
jgi:diguanylate cyclase (GGDEF)-like protein